MKTIASARERILAAVTKHGRCTTRDLAENCDLNQSYARRLANSMVVEGDIAVERRPGGHHFVPIIDEVK